MRFLFLVAILAASQVTLADAEAEINYRQGVMKSVGGHMSAMGAILKGRVHFEDFESHANAMAELATIVPNVFPAGSDKGKTEALAVIWEKSDEFQAAMDDFVAAANNIAGVAGGGNPRELGPAIQRLGQACKGCHDDFREQHDH
ncbi:MAG: cytochrome c [Pseudomonadales bacterium]